MTPEFGLVRYRRWEKSERKLQLWQWHSHNMNKYLGIQTIGNARWTNTHDVWLAPLLSTWNSFSCMKLSGLAFYFYAISWKIDQKFQKEVWKKIVPEMIWQQSNLKWHWCMVIT